jgi:DNA modification methylase
MDSAAPLFALRSCALASMTPYYSDSHVSLYHGDCREVLPEVRVTVDGVVTDPPFGIGFKYASHDDTPEGYGQFVWSVIAACENKCATASPIFVWQSAKNTRHFREWFPRDWRLFIAAKNFVQMRPVAMQWAYDPVVVWWTDDGEPYSEGTLSRDWHVANTSGVISRVTHEKAHPCPRPLDQIRHVIAQWIIPAGLVLDPFAGSGTTLVAAKSCGRRAVGIEIEERYCEIAAKRLSGARVNPNEPQGSLAEMFG